MGSFNFRKTGSVPERKESFLLSALHILFFLTRENYRFPMEIRWKRCEDAGLNPVLRCTLQHMQKLYINASVTKIKWKYKAYIGKSKKSYFRDLFEKVYSTK